jgi:hypothetical protein
VERRRWQVRVGERLGQLLLGGPQARNDSVPGNH